MQKIDGAKKQKTRRTLPAGVPSVPPAFTENFEIIRAGPQQSRPAL
jgi:hypothetical protein